MKNSYDIKHDAAGSSKGGYMRLELRAGEFRNYPTFRLLVESQRLIGLLFKVTEVKEHATSDDQKFITIYTELQTKIKNLFEKYKLSPKQMDDGVLEDDLVAKLATTDLQKECRSLISEYSKKVNELLKQTDQETVLVDEEEELLAA